ncbi:hypothetical protein L6452_07265 [Arctium lappa]|uniref:Uncharacterized protein n=1 Tax=Arctium lappa TaxID=4217 RepID=A0ACB9EL84_ARCLA|nr:hypothetical protein L6452_07265 [Arctium lappa]
MRRNKRPLRPHQEGDDKEEIAKLRKSLFKEFEMKDLGELKYFLGIEVLRSKQGIFMCQRKYVLDLLAETGMVDCKPADTPMIVNQKLYMKEKAELAEKERYRRMVGKLIYLSHTRPDIAYAVGVVSQFMHQPQKAHMEAVLRIIRYLKGTAGHGVLFRSNGHLETQLYTDADWAGDKGNRRSTAGYFTLVGGNLVTWRSKKQKVVALSSAEAEFRGIARGLTEVLWRLKKQAAGGGGGTEDFVDVLLKIQKEDSVGVPLEKIAIKALLLDAYTAGTDTTATVIEWAFTELLKHPKVFKKARDEVRTILNGKQRINQDDINNMKYLKAVFKETLRLHPPIPTLVPRVACQDVKVMGYDVEKGTRVIINAWAIARDPKVWDEPEEFRPERFLDSSIDFKGLDFNLIPFGAGRRGCPGIAFAMATNENILANLLHKFDWELPNGDKADDLDTNERTGLTIRKKTPLLAVATPFSS